uniref:PH domain-containing protein n=1 Tax=Guillardia theta TaxID=55529 RepID=A0A7S4KGK8_GUITH|mmetsp:Transcript_2452/g.7636  ORF Transcript_2452/g.7636 Transcript_2452/m.7636 type:complete len:746 (+) Transcript_2452:143-2380(+)
MMEIKPEQDDANFATEAELQEIERLFSEFVDEATVMVDKLPKEQADSLMKEVVAHNDGLAGMIYQHAVSNATSATRLPEMSQISSSELKEAERLVSNAFHEANSMLDGLPQAHAQVILQDLCEGKSELAIFLRSHILKDKRDSVQEFDDNLGISNSQNLLDELEAASSSMMEKLPESYARILVEGIKHGQSPLCRAVRHQINQRYIAGRLQEDPDNEIITDGDLSLASFHQRLDEIFLQMSRSIQELQEAVQGLKISLLEKEREVESLQQQLKHLPVIRVMEILHADGTKCLKVVTSRTHVNLESRSADYQYNCLSLQDEELLKMKVRGRANGKELISLSPPHCPAHPHLISLLPLLLSQREADESRRKAEEAAQEVERARREAAEEEFRFEAAKAEIRLEAFRAQQRKESQQESIKKADKRRGAEPELMEGWIKVKREGPLGGWQRKMLVLRSTGLLLFNDENRSGGCSNAFGLEIVSSIARKKGTCVEVKFQGRGSDWWEKSSCSRQPRTTPDVTSSPFCPPLSLPLSSPPHLHPRPRPFSCSTLGSEHILIALIPSSDSSSCEWDLGSSQSVDKWIAAIETALIRCRRMTLDIRPREITEEVLKSSWDSAQEEKMRLEIERRRKRVAEAQQRSEEAVRALDRARKEHIVLDEELRRRRKFPDLPDAFLDTLPFPQSRDGIRTEIVGESVREDVHKIAEESRKKAIEEERQKADKMRAELEEKVEARRRGDPTERIDGAGQGS